MADILVSEKKTAQILHVEELICDSHRQEKLLDEEIAVTKIKMDPSYLSMDEDNELYLVILYYLQKLLLEPYMSSPPVQQQDQMVFHFHYWSTALLN